MDVATITALNNVDYGGCSVDKAAGEHHKLMPADYSVVAAPGSGKLLDNRVTIAPLTNNSSSTLTVPLNGLLYTGDKSDDLSHSSLANNSSNSNNNSSNNNSVVDTMKSLVLTKAVFDQHLHQQQQIQDQQQALYNILNQKSATASGRRRTTSTNSNG